MDTNKSFRFEFSIRWKKEKARFASEWLMLSNVKRENISQFVKEMSNKLWLERYDIIFIRPITSIIRCGFVIRTSINLVQSRCFLFLRFFLWDLILNFVFPHFLTNQTVLIKLWYRLLFLPCFFCDILLFLTIRLHYCVFLSNIVFNRKISLAIVS